MDGKGWIWFVPTVSIYTDLMPGVPCKSICRWCLLFFIRTNYFRQNSYTPAYNTTYRSKQRIPGITGGRPHVITVAGPSCRFYECDNFIIKLFLFHSNCNFHAVYVTLRLRWARSVRNLSNTVISVGLPQQPDFYNYTNTMITMVECVAKQHARNT